MRPISCGLIAALHQDLQSENIFRDGGMARKFRCLKERYPALKRQDFARFACGQGNARCRGDGSQDGSGMAASRLVQLAPPDAVFNAKRCRNHPIARKREDVQGKGKRSARIRSIGTNHRTGFTNPCQRRSFNISRPGYEHGEGPNFI